MKVLKFISKALFGLHLWLPIAYSIGFLAIVAISGLFEGSWPYYFIGLSLSLAGSLGLVYYSSVRARVKSPEKATPAPEEKPVAPRPQPSSRPDYESVEEAAARIRDEQQRYAQAMKANPSGNINGAQYADVQTPAPAPKAETFMRPEAMQQYYGDAVRPEMTAQTAHDALYSSFSAPPAPGEAPQNNQFSPYVQPSNVAAGSPKLDDYESTRRTRTGEPKVYRTRKEPNVIIYEYEDCYEKYYLNPDGSQTYLCTETKR